ncbi:hypothetical protein HNY73_009317 [Argiope bruennichi]|uniref:LRRNT domain-containing protein n=1 Tax=Argiope bruennichi TaxID=94029 RepID=A0A8T0FEP0_ARGBR|nr:hypothetical protein HNY73_009317 [Argiope bruennichi]
MYLTILVVVLLLGFTSGDESRMSVCPQVCDCKGLTVDCGNRQLKSVPKPLPKEAKRICTNACKCSSVALVSILAFGPYDREFPDWIPIKIMWTIPGY